MQIPEIVLVGPFLDVSGTAEVNRNIYLALFDLGIKVKLVDLPYWSHIKAELSPEVREKIDIGLHRNDVRNDIALHLCPPDPFRGVPDVGAKLQFSYTVFETDKCPILWRDVFNGPTFHEIWVSCDFHKEAYIAQGVNKDKIKVINFGMDTDKFNPNATPLEFKDKKKFNFGTSLDWSERKNPRGMVTAFLQEFDKDEDVAFIIKSYTGYGDDAAAEGIKNEIRRIRAMLRSKANILFVKDYLHSDLLPNFHTAIDTWVNLSRGEGWDLGTLQSMACGVPVVGADNTSHQVYLNKENGYPVSCQKVAITNQEFLAKNPQFMGHSWYEPNLKDARRLMRQAYDEWKSGEIVNKKKASRQAALNLPWKNCAVKIIFEIGKYLK